MNFSFEINNKYISSDLEAKLRAVEESELKLKLKIQTLETDQHQLRYIYDHNI